MGYSTIQLSDIVDDASTLGDVAPALATGGFSNAPALSIANDVITNMMLGGPEGEPFNWKWNRFYPTPFPTISYQQDYFIPGLVKLGWLENSWAININQTSVNKQKVPMEARKDLDVTYTQTGYPDKICWLPNRLLLTGTWGQSPLGPTAGNTSGQTNVTGITLAGTQNPGPNVIYTNPIGVANQIINATTNIKDSNGNFWALTTYGTCGSTEPNWPSNPVFPTYVDPTITATTVADGSVVWTAINPDGQGLRLNPIPPQNGVVWMINPIGQLRIPRFTSLQDYLDPIPDDWVSYFKQGFFCECFRRNPDPKVRAKYPDEFKNWMNSLRKAVMQGAREIDDYGFFPGSASVMDVTWTPVVPRPDYPYGPY